MRPAFGLSGWYSGSLRLVNWRWSSVVGRAQSAAVARAGKSRAVSRVRRCMAEPRWDVLAMLRGAVALSVGKRANAAKYSRYRRPSSTHGVDLLSNPAAAMEPSDPPAHQADPHKHQRPGKPRR